MTENQVQKQPIQSPQKLTDQLRQFADFIKSITLSLPKQGRRLLSMASLQKSKNVMMAYVLNQKSFKFTQFEQYADLLSKESHNRINDQVYKNVLNLQTKLRSYQYQQKVKDKQKQLEQKAKQRQASNEKTINKKEKKNQKSTENITFPQCSKQFESIKTLFHKIWREEYFMIMNYRMAIAARQIQRWTQIAEKKTTKEQIAKQVQSLFS